MISTRRTRSVLALAGLGLTVTACTPSESTTDQNDSAPTVTQTGGRLVPVVDTVIIEAMDVAGTAEAWQHVELHTKLTGTVTSVSAREGDVVSRGQVLVQIDSREMAAKAAQIAASLTGAEAMRDETALHAARFRALFADSAATRAQLDAALSAAARADAGVRAAKAAATELDVTESYAAVRAPFSGVVTARHVDPGALASAGVPLLSVEDISRLRVSAAASADVVRGLVRGQLIATTIDDSAATAHVDAIVPSTSAGLFTILATVDNAARQHRVGSIATLHVPSRSRRALLVPINAISYEGDLTGVIVRHGALDERRWVRLGTVTKTHAEIVSGVVVGDSIVVPPLPTREK